MNGTSRRGFIGMLAALAAAPAALTAKVDSIKQYKHIPYWTAVTFTPPVWTANDKETFLELGRAVKYDSVRTGVSAILRAQYVSAYRESIFWTDTRKFGGDTVYVIVTSYDFSGKIVPGGCIWRMTKTPKDMNRIVRKYREMEWDMLENTCMSKCSEIPHALINGGGI